MQSIKLAYFGAGNFAQMQHLPELIKRDSVTVSSVVDPSELDLLKFAQIHQDGKGTMPRTFSSLDDFLVSPPDFDAAVIATPVDSHFVLATALLEFGKPLYIEKPFMVTSREALEITSKADHLGVSVVIGANRCVFPAYRAAANALHQGVIGTFLGISIYYRHRWDEITKQSHWRQDSSHPASGILMDHFAHYGHYLADLGFTPRIVRHLGTAYNGNGVDTGTCFFLQDMADRKALLLMDGSPVERERKEEIKIYGALGRITVRFENRGSNAYLQIFGKDEEKLDTVPALSEIGRLGISDYRSHPALLHHFLGIVQGDVTENVSPACNGVAVASITEAVLKSRGDKRTSTLTRENLAELVTLFESDSFQERDSSAKFYENGRLIYLQ